MSHQSRSVVCWSVGLSVCHTSEPAIAAELIEMPFRLRTRVDPNNHILDGCPYLPVRMSNLGGEGVAHCKV